MLHLHTSTIFPRRRFFFEQLWGYRCSHPCIRGHPLCSRPCIRPGAKPRRIFVQEILEISMKQLDFPEISDEFSWKNMKNLWDFSWKNVWKKNVWDFWNDILIHFVTVLTSMYPLVIQHGQLQFLSSVNHHFYDLFSWVIVSICFHSNLLNNQKVNPHQSKSPMIRPLSDQSKNGVLRRFSLELRPVNCGYSRIYLDWIVEPCTLW